MGFLGRIVDAVDNAVTDARARHGAQREAAQFQASVRPGDTIYVTDAYALPEGERHLTTAYTVGRGGRVGSSTVAGLVLRSAAVTRGRPAGLMTLAEYTEAQNAAEPPDMTSGLKPPKRARTLARR